MLHIGVDDILIGHHSGLVISVPLKLHAAKNTGRHGSEISSPDPDLQN